MLVQAAEHSDAVPQAPETHLLFGYNVQCQCTVNDRNACHVHPHQSPRYKRLRAVPSTEVFIAASSTTHRRIIHCLMCVF
jgi:hypothetical protein